MKRLIGISILNCILLAGCGNSTLDKDYLNIAHRGASGSKPEHTYASYDKAIKQNADYTELDLQMTKDKKLIAMHDNKVDRTTNGTGLVKDKTLKEIKSLDAGSWFDKKYKNEKVPELNDILNKYKDKTNFYIETKHPDMYPGMDKKLIKDLENNGLLKKESLKKGNLIIQSFSETSLQNIHKLNENIPLIHLIDDKDVKKLNDKEMERLSEFTYGLGFNKDIVNEKLVEKVHKHGLKVHVFTLNNEQEVQEMKDINVDGAFNNNP
ncbi:MULTISPECIES: glycerophosphodiester phosphodiesterase family protein [Mammaliicoccus]|uniref:Glycerophosphodiester phosphodiesterase family protein n=1 Tax=Mammaliicoccus sciuri TaxID=1296 RepID=A0ABT7I044_MAMSC|nr:MULTISPECIES: glycerophosphodiester phosphodiesterase family protein [Mammaliicoccus]MCJ0914773.1 glycerophosphodiester phosphodiesterase [Mammaliicoccus sciuri]MDL0113491.1 glycerophosphodiester phosphodiesterase family protein [Mammaliicoccus sciuri]MDL0117722.1 glycerophosphodiester phosphodiesterase family protein [Mammaliicoccus sciuri]WQJ66197.1 glycerophosphodiester phosphodiesterase family protein [Mammaliicoccus sciuri]